MIPTASRQQVGHLISQLMLFIIQGVHLEFLASKNITQTQFVILVAVSSNKQSTMKQLADNMHVSMPTMSGIVDRMVRTGYLKRLASDTDRRQVVVTLSAKGEAFIKQFQSTISQRWQEVLTLLEPEDLVAFEHIIKQLIGGMRKRQQTGDVK